MRYNHTHSAHPGSAHEASTSLSSPSSAEVLVLIPCCVPYWDTEKFLNAGGKYTKERGFFADGEAYLPDLTDWLPRKWQHRGDPPVPVLLPDMLPTSSWESNLRSQLKPEEWDRLRRFCYQAAGNTCVACGSRGEPHVEAHEAWRFDEKTGVQTLRGLLCLCPTCHKCKHIGYSRRIGLYQQVLDRLKWLNDWDSYTLAQELDKVGTRQDELSKRTWTLDLSFLRTYGVR